MAKPPADTNPEKFVIGRGAYTNIRTARPYHDAHEFRIDPAPMPVVMIYVCNVVFIAFFFGFHWLVESYGPAHLGPWVVYGIPLGIGVMTCGLFTGIVWYMIRRAQQQGPWLIYERATGRVTLPREAVTFEPEEIVHLQDVTTKRLDWGGVANNDRVSELNLVTCRDGKRQRWPLLRSLGNVGAFDYILRPLVEHTSLPVMRVQDQWLGWEITETPYNG